MAVAAAVGVVVSSSLGAPAARTGPTVQFAGYRVAVRTVPLGGGVTHLVADVHGTALAGPTAGTDRSTATDETAFAVALMQRLAASAGDGNVLDSPLSADIALSMLELGARGSTRTGIADALHSSTLSAGHQAAAWGRLQSELRASGRDADMQLADSTWVQKGVGVQPTYLAELAQSLGDVAYQADFAGNIGAATAAIDHWVDTATDGRIPRLYPPGSLDPSTLLVLVNALHFHAAWPATLEMHDGTETFLDGSGSGRSVPTIVGSGEMRLATTNRYVSVAVPYVGGRYQAVAIEPTTESVDNFVRTLTGPSLSGLLSSLRPASTSLIMPALSLSSAQSLDQELAAMGMGQALSPSADFSGILPGASVSTVRQDARLRVDRYGTDAAAATGIGMSFSASTVRHLVTINRPYVLLLRDTRTGTILMTSVVHHP
jgi:serpin B